MDYYQAKLHSATASNQKLKLNWHFIKASYEIAFTIAKIKSEYPCVYMWSEVD